MAVTADEKKRYDGPTQSAVEVDNQWAAHPGMARTVRVSIVLIPLLITFALTWWAGRYWPPQRVGLNRWVWWAALMILSWALLRGLNHIARKFTPIAAMLQVSMIFPDEAPSRARTALRSTNGKKILREFKEAEAAGLAPPEVPSSEFLASMLRALADHEPLTRGHSERVRAYTDLIADELDLPQEDQHKLRWAALLHDIGKLEVPAEILNSKHKPTDEEWEILKTHPSHGGHMMEPLSEWLGEWALAAEQHHMRWDGNGYPEGLAGTEISLAGRIVAVADAYDVMTSIRSYKQGMSPEAARRELARCSGAQFDPMVVRAFLAVGVGRLRAALGPFGSIVGLLETFRLPFTPGLIATAGSAAAGAAVATMGAVTGVVPEPAPEAIPFAEPIAVLETVVDAEFPEDSPGSIVIEGTGGAGQITITIAPASEGQVTTGATTINPEPGEEWSFEVDYAPTADFNGIDSFNYTICDENDDCQTGTANITITPTNDAPIATDDRAEPLTAGPVVINVLANDFDPDGDPIAIRFLGTPVNGTVTVVGTSIRYEPDAEFRGIEVLEYDIVDEAGATSTATITIDLSNLNTPPTALPDAATGAEDDAITIDLLANDTDPEDETPAGALTIVTTPTHGTLVRNVDRTITYTPDADYFGDDTFTYRVADSDGRTSAPTAVDITIDPINDPPTITSSGPITISEDAGPSARNWASGISAGPGESGQSLLITTTNDNPTLFAVEPTLGSDGILTFTPAPDAYGTATVTITLTDDGGSANGGTDITGPITLTLTINPVNDPPTFTPGPDVTVLEDSGPYSVSWANNISAGPPDEASQTVTFTVTTDNDALFANQPSIAPNGTLTYTPAPDTHGSSTVTVTLTDNGVGAASTSRTFLIVVDPVNDAPTFTPGPGLILALEDSGLHTTPWATDIAAGPPDENGQSLLFTLTNSDPTLFALQPTIDLGGTLTFMPAASTSGTATITATLTDNGGSANGGDDTSTTSTFDVTIGSVNDAPAFQSGPPVAVLEDSGAYSASWATAISPGPPEESIQAVAFTTTNDDNPLFAIQPAVAPDGTLTFTPAVDAVGTATVTVTLSDDGGTINGGSDTSAPAVFTIILDPVNDAPTFTGPDLAVDEDSGAYSALWPTALSAGPPDESAQTLIWSVTNDDNGLFSVQPSIAPDGTLTFTPTDDLNGTATVTVGLMDNGGTANGGVDSAPNQTFTLTVGPVNDVPAFDMGADITVFEDSGAFSALNWAVNMRPGPLDEAAQILTFNVTNDDNTLFAVQPAVAPDGTLTFTPADDAAGTTTVTVTLSDDGGTANGGVDTTAPATFTITLDPVNDAPFFTAGAPVVVDEDSGAHSAPWATGVGTGPPNESAQIPSFALTNSDNTKFAVQPAIAADGTLTFTPAADAVGVVDVGVQLFDDGGTANGGVDSTGVIGFSITLNPMPDAPTGVADGYFSYTDTTLTVATIDGLLVNDYDVDGDPIAVNATPLAGPTDGVVTLNPDGSFDYTPSPGFAGTDSFTYEVEDGTGLTGSAVVDIEVVPLTGILISQYSGENEHSQGDFVEIYNATSTAIDISGWELHISDNDAVEEIVVVDAGTIMPPGGFFLFGREDEGYFDAGFTDQTFADALPNKLGLGIFDGTTYIDQVGTRDDNPADVSLLGEGLGLPRFNSVKTDLDQSYRRLPDLGRGHCQDTGDNSFDFHAVYSRTNAHNSTSAPEPCAAGTIPAPTPSNLIISEIRTEGPNPNSGQNEFIEVFNPTTGPIALDGFYLFDSDGDYEVFWGVGSPVLQPGQSVVVGGADYTGPSDFVMSDDGVKNNGWIQLRWTDFAFFDFGIDFVGFDTDVPMLPEFDNHFDHSYERLESGCVDLGGILDNFARIGIPTPRLLADPPLPCP